MLHDRENESDAGQTRFRGTTRFLRLGAKATRRIRRLVLEGLHFLAWIALLYGYYYPLTKSTQEQRRSRTLRNVAKGVHR